MHNCDPIRIKFVMGQYITTLDPMQKIWGRSVVN